jgi:hypothetical protein
MTPLGLGLLSLLLAAPPSPPPRAVLCFDAAHHNVHTVDRGYRAFAELAGEDGFELEVLTGRWTGETLRPCRVLAVVAPRGGAREATLKEKGRPAFNVPEVGAAVEWLSSGGGLLLVTDHAPIGAATAPLAEALGVSMSNGFTEDPEHTDPETGAILFTREAGTLASHPVSDGSSGAERVERVGAFLGQSLSGPDGATSFLTLGPGAEDRFLIATDHRWHEPSPADRRASAAGRSQGLAFSLGDGRVVVLGDAAMLAALHGAPSGLDEPRFDNRRLAVNVLRWLAGRL